MTLLKIGDQAPDFDLLDQYGHPRTLAGFLGKYVIIYFYPKASTPGCTLQACSIRDKLHELHQRQIEVIGISADPPQKLHQFAEKEQLNFTLLSDPTHETLVRYGVWQQKRMYGKPFHGINRTTYVLNPLGKIVFILPKVDPRSHLSEIFAWFDASQPSTGV